jgi:hypothetical protein
MRYRLLLLITLLILAAAATISLASLHHGAGPLRVASYAAIRPAQIDEEEYAVYSVLINSNLKTDEQLKESGEPKDRVLILEDKPMLWDGSVAGEEDKFFEDLQKTSTELQPETINDLRVKSKETAALERKLSLKINYQLVSDEEVAGFFKEGGGGWEAFHKKYPKSSGIMSVSRVGFNAAKTQALVYTGWSCGGLCGGGGYTLLTKKKGVWVKKRDVGPTWVS